MTKAYSPRPLRCAPKDILRKLTALTGRPALPPAWSFGLWLTTSFTTSYDEATVTGFINGMKERDLPLQVFHFDCFWMREFDWCSFQVGRAHLSRSGGFAAPLAGARPANLRLDQSVHRAALGAVRGGPAAGLFAQASPTATCGSRTSGSRAWRIVDFTNPAARAWFAGHLRAADRMGVDCFKTDFGERIPTDVVYHDGSDPVRMHNYYSVLYNETVFSAAGGGARARARLWSSPVGYAHVRPAVSGALGR